VAADHEGDQSSLLEQGNRRLKRKGARSSREDEDHRVAESVPAHKARLV
jgi:hypothetical protein